MMRNCLLSSLILFMLFFYIPLDMLNGFFLQNGYPSISFAFKALVLFLILVFLLLQNKHLYISSIASILFIFLLIHIVMYGDLILAIKGLDWMIKFIGITAYFMFFRELILINQSDKIFLFTKLSFLFLVFNFALALLGFGYPMYSGGIGSKGFIYAGNEIGAAVIISGSIILIYFLEQKKYKIFFGVALAMLAISALLTSKVSILGSLLIILFFPILSFFKNLSDYKIPKRNFIFSSTILVTLPILFMGSVYYALFKSNLIERLNYHYAKIDLITLIFSHRNIWAAEAWDAFINQYTLIEQLFGMSKEWFIYISGEKQVEIDIIDFLMSYGVSGVILVTTFLIFIFTQLCKNRKKNPYFFYLLFSYFLVGGLSLTSGHIINSGISGALIGALFAFSMFQKNIKGN